MELDNVEYLSEMEINEANEFIPQIDGMSLCMFFIRCHIILLFSHTIVIFYINTLEDNITEECNSNTYNTATSHSNISVSYNDLQISETVSEQIIQSIIQYCDISIIH